VRDIEVQGKRVLVRVDFNVPMQDGQITDDRRIRESLPTIQYLLERGATVILMSHFGRPKGQRDPKYSLRPVATRLEQLLGRPVHFFDDCIGAAVEAGVASLPPNSVALLENVRFYPQEEANDPEFARALARLGEVYVNDAFGSAHRAHASTEGVAHYLPAVAGLLMEKELRYLGQALANPERPFVAILGGAKVHDKIGVIQNLLPKVDTLLIGGGMAFTFLKAQGYEIGKSLLDAESLEFPAQMLRQAGDKLVLPIDVVVAPRAGAEHADPDRARQPDPARPDGAGHRRRDGAYVQRDRAHRAYRRVERASGRVRDPAVRAGHARRAKCACRVGRGLDSGRGRHGSRRRATRLRRPNDPHLHGRRRIAGVSGGQNPARRRCALGCLNSGQENPIHSRNWVKLGVLISHGGTDYATKRLYTD
jgi:3-phosphoglycerate kinase